MGLQSSTSLCRMNESRHVFWITQRSRNSEQYWSRRRSRWRSLELPIDYFMDINIYYNRKWHISRDQNLIQWHTRALKILDNSTHIRKIKSFWIIAHIREFDQVFLVSYGSELTLIVLYCCSESLFHLCLFAAMWVPLGMSLWRRRCARRLPRPCKADASET